MQRKIAGLAGERIAPSLTRPTRVSWTSRYWEITNSCTLRRDAARERAYELLRGNPRWRPWGLTRRTPRKVRNTLTTHSTEWAVRVFHSLTKQATCYITFEYIYREKMTLLSAPRHFRRSDAVPRKSMNSERKGERRERLIRRIVNWKRFAIINQFYLFKDLKFITVTYIVSRQR